MSLVQCGAHDGRGEVLRRELTSGGGDTDSEVAARFGRKDGRGSWNRERRLASKFIAGMPNELNLSCAHLAALPPSPS